LSTIAAERWPELDAEAEIRGGHIWVDGFPRTNPAMLVARDASIVLRTPRPLAGEAKLRAALAAFSPAIAGRIALDIGAAAGGFTRVLLEAGASRVYAVDAGFGQLLGSLRQDPRVVNLERTNLGELDGKLVPATIDIVTIDVSYISLASAVPQLAQLSFAPTAELIALVKPMFELALAEAPTDPVLLADAVRRATTAIEAVGWHVVAAIDSPVLGHHGAHELLLHARRATSETSP
jgi:23S rRNA (cytidine1920-2'-O)/16S rRNA (cytidine1409-2'-O)-methyltransferase